MTILFVTVHIHCNIIYVCSFSPVIRGEPKLCVCVCARVRSRIVWVPAPSQEEEGSGTLRINDLFFTEIFMYRDVIACAYNV